MVPPPPELELSPSLELSFLEAFGHMSSTRMDCMPLPASQLPHSLEQPLTADRSSAALAALLFNVQPPGSDSVHLSQRCSTSWATA